MSSELIKWKYKIVKTLKEYICKKPRFSQLSWYLDLGIEGRKRIWYLLKAGLDYSQLIKIICYKKSRILKINFVIIWFGLIFNKMHTSACHCSSSNNTMSLGSWSHLTFERWLDDCWHEGSWDLQTFVVMTNSIKLSLHKCTLYKSDNFNISKYRQILNVFCLGLANFANKWIFVACISLSCFLNK